MVNIFNNQFVIFIGLMCLIIYYPQVIIGLMDICEIIIWSVISIFIFGLILEGIKLVAESIERGVDRAFGWIGFR